MSKPSIGEQFENFVEIMARLRGPNGCPWDREQTHQSLMKYLIEESYEVAESIEEEDWDALAEELGDVLLQIVFHARMAQEAETFTIRDVIQKITDKMINRHPHVFGDATANDSAEVLKRWETSKREEKPERESILDGIPRNLPALMRAHRLQDRAAGCGFDWEKTELVIDKMEEELREFRHAYQCKQTEETREEFGDLLFALVNVARFVDVDPEECLRAANDKFTARFRHIERELDAQGVSLDDASLEQMDALWDDAKKKEVR